MNRLSLRIALCILLVACSHVQAADVLDWAKFNARVEESIPHTYMPEPHRAVIAKQLYSQLDALSQQDKLRILGDINKLPLNTQGFLVHYFRERKDTWAVPTLVRLFDTTKDDTTFFQAGIVDAVADLAGGSQRTFLNAALRYPSSHVRRSAAIALAKLPYDRESILRLAEALGHETDSSTEVALITALGKFSKQDDFARGTLRERLLREKEVSRVLNEALGEKN